MNTIVKINSNEGGQFNAQNNRVSFDLMSDKYYDLSTAYINLVMSCDVTAENTTAQGLGTYVPIVRFTDSGGGAENYVYDNAALVRTCRMDSDTRGNIEELQRCDILRQNLNYYSKSNDQKESENYARLVQPFQKSRTKGSLFAELHKEGQVLSRNLSRQPIRIKLSELMNFCKTTQYNTGKYGRTRLELQLNLDRLAAATQYLGTGAANEDFIMTNNALQGGTTNDVGRLMNATNAVGAGTFGAPVSGDLTSFYIAQDVAAGAATGIVPRVFNRPEDSPYYVGQKVVITGTYVAGAGGGARGGGGLPVTRRIERIQFNRGQGVDAGAGGVNVAGTICITLNAPIQNGGNLIAVETYHSLVIRGDTCTFGPVVCDFAELVVEELAPQNVGAEPDTITYTTFKTEEVDCGAVAAYRHNFMAEPNAVNFYITQPTDNTNRCILSRQNGVDSYRLRIDNKDTSARDIFLRDSGGGVRSNGNDPLHTIKQQNALVNSDRSVRDLKERMKNQQTNTGQSLGAYDTDLMLIGQVLPMTAAMKNIQVNINCRAGQTLQNLAVFREVVQEI